MTVQKRKVSMSLDEDLVAELEKGSEALSAQVNEAIRAVIEKRRHQQALGNFLDQLDLVHGPLDTAEDERQISRFVRLLTDQL
jgi:metal-responsive CopG/Arc/MetJ family transcriptional regulator